MAVQSNAIVQKCHYCMRISVVSKVCLKEALLDVLHDPLIGGLPRNKHLLHQVLLNFKTAEKRNLRRVIKPFQWDKICHCCSANCPAPCPRQGQTDFQDLDITCIVILILNLDKISPNIHIAARQNIKPYAKDSREIRNELIHGTVEMLNTKPQFDHFWDRIETALNALGYKNIALFNALKTSSLDPYLKQQIDSLQDKYQYLEITKSSLADMESAQTDLKILQITIAYIIQTKCDKQDLTGLQNQLSALEMAVKQKTEEMKQQVDFLLDNKEVSEQRFENIEERLGNLEIEQEFETATSQMLKDEMKTKHEKVQIALENQPSIFAKNIMNRDEIVVDLSVIMDAKSAFATFGCRNLNVARQKQKELASKEINYQDLVTSLNDYIIVSGSPGSGKTTLIETLLHKWADDKLWEKDDLRFDFVFVVYLRGLVRFKDQHDVSAEKILSHFYPKHKFHQTKTLLILEGFDELFGKENLRKMDETSTNYTQAIRDLLDPNNKILSCTRMVTSHPGSCPILFETVLSQPYTQTMRLIEVSGFSDKNICCYVEKHFPDKVQAQNLVEKLKDMPIVYDLMTTPFYCWGVCYLLKNDMEMKNIGNTRTALFTNLLILYICMHGFPKQSVKPKNILRDERFKNVCLNLAELAFTLVENGKINFSRDDLPEINQLEELIRHSGLILELESDGISNLSPTYQFLHYTFHEFLAALHMFITGKTKVKSRNKQVLFMLAGLVGGSLSASESDLVVQEFSKLFCDSEMIDIKDILTECNGSTQCDDVISMTSSSLFSIIFEYHNPINVPLDMTLVTIELVTNSYQIQIRNYFQKQCKSKKLRLGTLDIICFHEETDCLISLLSVCCCRKLTFTVKDDTLKNITEYITEKMLNFEKITLVTSHEINKAHLMVLLQHCNIFEILSQFYQLSDVIEEFGEYKQICKGKTITLYLNKKDLEGLDFSRMIDMIDICEELVICYPSTETFNALNEDEEDNDEEEREINWYEAINHLHDKDCFPDKEIQEVKNKFEQSLPADKCFKLLRKVKFFGWCMYSLFTFSMIVYPPSDNIMDYTVCTKTHKKSVCSNM